MKLLEVISNVGNKENLQLYDNSAYLDMWEQWYSGKVKSFHNYKIWNGKRYVPMERLSLQMGKKVCEDWANLLMNEKTDITIGDENAQKSIEQIFEDTNFWLKANKGIEKTFASGIGAWIISVKDLSIQEDGSILKDGKINISFCNGKMIRPITIEDDKITECAFISTKTNDKLKNNIYTLQIHLKDANGLYVIYSLECTGTDENNLQFNPEKVTRFNTGSDKPWFICLMPNIANNININSPLGISIFANSIDTLKQIDLVYDSMANEFILGRKRIFIDARQQTMDMKDGEISEVFDSNDVVFYILPETDSDKPTIQNDTQELRVDAHENALQGHLNRLSYQCGFGTEHYKFNGGTVATATQIISENSEMFRSIKKQEVLIEEALKTLVKTLIYVSNTFTPITIKDGVNIEIKFDDSIIEDKTAERTQDRLDVSLGVMSKAQYRSKWYNEDLETAQKTIDELDTFKIPDDTEVEE